MIAAIRHSEGRTQIDQQPNTNIRVITMQKLITLAAALTLLSGCATYKPIPEGYSGPTATIADSYIREDSSKGQLFVLAAYDGHQIDNGISATRRATEGQGFHLSVQDALRRVPAKPFKAKLVATHVTGAPIHELYSRARGTFFSVEGEIEFTPAPDGDYIVRGELKEDGSSVWIEDARTKQPVTAKIRDIKKEGG